MLSKNLYTIGEIKAMIIFPAVDIKDGKCVRLKQGKAQEVTIFSPDPCEMAKHWENLGAEYLHLVDLDGALKGPLKTTLLYRGSAPLFPYLSK